VCVDVGGDVQAKKLHFAVADLRMAPIVDFAASPMKEKEWYGSVFVLYLYFYFAFLHNGTG
jgi:hypothetical protein